MVNNHAGQFDKGGKPYALHPLTVMNLLQTDDEELQCIALGHDLIEDTKVTYKQLYDEGISERVICGIRAMTKLPGQTQEEYETVVCSNIDAIRVKIADLQHNTDIRRLKGVSDKDIARMTKYHQMYMRLVNELRIRDTV